MFSLPMLAPRYPMLPAMDISDIIRRRRAELGLTQADVAKAVGVKRSAVAQWEGGGARQKRPGRENIVRLAAVLQISPAELLGSGADGRSEPTTKDLREVALVTLFRRMSPRQQNSHLSLFYTTVGVPEPIERKANPKKRGPIGTIRSAK